jgi:hypothetical protein
MVRGLLVADTTLGPTLGATGCPAVWQRLPATARLAVVRVLGRLVARIGVQAGGADDECAHGVAVGAAAKQDPGLAS